jgi:hypothetical protein
MANDRVQYRSACGCIQYESGLVSKCQRHIANWSDRPYGDLDRWYDRDRYQAA